jgi:hypothetical protein
MEFRDFHLLSIYFENSSPQNLQQFFAVKSLKNISFGIDEFSG